MSHYCQWTGYGIELTELGLYTGYTELQQCAFPECSETRKHVLPRTLPDNPYLAGKINNQGPCPCQVCAQTRKVWLR